jgi:hypothetical protein
MINIEWINSKKTCFEIKSINETLFEDFENTNSYNNSTDLRNLLCCEAEYCPLNAKSFWRGVPYYILWPTNNFVVINILFGGGLLTEYEQIKNYILLNKNKISLLKIKLIGSSHLNKIMELNKHNTVLAYNKLDENRERARCFEAIYLRWGNFYNKLNNLCKINNIKLQIQIFKDIGSINNTYLSDDMHLSSIKFKSNIIFTFDSVDDTGSSIPVYTALKNKLLLDNNNQNVTALNISSTNNPFDEDINIMFSNKFFNIAITNVNKKIGLFVGGLVGIGVGTCISIGLHVGITYLIKNIYLT